MDMDYVIDSVLWSVVCFFLGYLLGLIQHNLHHLWKDHDDHS